MKEGDKVIIGTLNEDDYEAIDLWYPEMIETQGLEGTILEIDLDDNTAVVDLGPAYEDRWYFLADLKPAIQLDLDKIFEL